MVSSSPAFSTMISSVSSNGTVIAEDSAGRSTTLFSFLNKVSFNPLSPLLFNTYSNRFVRSTSPVNAVTSTASAPKNTCIPSTVMVPFSTPSWFFGRHKYASSFFETSQIAKNGPCSARNCFTSSSVPVPSVITRSPAILFNVRGSL